MDNRSRNTMPETSAASSSSSSSGNNRKSLAASAEVVSGMVSSSATATAATMASKKHLKPSSSKENQQQESNLSQTSQHSADVVPKKKSTATTKLASNLSASLAVTASATSPVLSRPPVEFQDSPANHIKKSRKSLKEVDLVFPPHLLPYDSHLKKDSTTVDQLVSESANMARMSMCADRQRRRSSFSLRGKRRSSYGELQGMHREYSDPFDSP